MFCEFCGTKIKKPKTNKPEEENSKLYNQVLFELKFEKYSMLEQTLFKALLEEPDNNDLLLVNAALLDVSVVDRIDFSAVSDIFRSLCRKPLLNYQLTYNYSLDYNELKKHKYSEIKQLKLEKLDINTVTDTVNYLKLAKFILSNDMYEQKVRELNELNDKAFAEHKRKFKRWKAVYRKRVVWSIIWFVLAAFFLLLVLGDISVVPAIVFFSFGVIAFSIRKSYIPS
jgi:hypothetical protein